MSERHDFISKAQSISNDEVHRKRLLKVIQTYDTAVTARRQLEYIDWQKARELAAQVKDYALDHLAELLCEFEEKSSAHGAKVLWASNTKEALDYIAEIVTKHRAKMIVKSKSMTTEELFLNEFLEERGVKVWETDLGEFIVQLAGQKPYHIVTPAMHKSKEEISRLFHEKLSSPLSDNAEELTGVARTFLREKYVSADIGITGANFLVADTGAVVMIENEGNGRLSMSCPPIHIVVAGIEKIIPRLADLELFLPLLATSGTGQGLSCYASIVKGPKKENENDGPKEMFVILLDNGRSEIYKEPEFQKSLRCIRCGACLNACPVYKTIGGYTYNTTYMGPIGSVITPHLLGMSGWHHLSDASSLCGMCTEVCPVNIPIHHMLLLNRARSYNLGYKSLFWRIALKVWAYFAAKRERLAFIRPFLKLGSYIAAALSSTTKSPTPKLSKKSFADMWREYEQK